MARIAVLVGPEFEDSELTVPVARLTDAGHEVELLGVEAGRELIGKQRKTKVQVNAAVSDRRPEDYDALVIPGGNSPEHLRTDEGVVDFVRAFGSIGRPIAAICHGPQLLIEADLVRGRRMTSWPSVRTELRNAGAEVVDEEVVQDGAFITSRMPADLEAFSRGLLDRLEHREGRSIGQAVQSRPS
ncbi:MAG TPA: type 1 glutamine amidotransferase domain-containing protein [Kofleriaceae bacterium]|nr:type 1 glutamine amidotransferase domain-containing protein [Kofleriaceae bacterium]